MTGLDAVTLEIRPSELHVSRPRSPAACPVALALQRVMPPGTVRVHRHVVSYYACRGSGQHTKYLAALPPGIVAWLRNYDRGLVETLPEKCTLSFTPAAPVSSLVDTSSRRH